MIRVTLIVPTRNRAAYVAKNLDSMLHQDLDPCLYEILVLDNNSTDDTREVAQQVLSQAKCRWDVITEPRLGVHHARNKGILTARGDIIVFGDDDIIACPSWLSSILEEFDQHPQTGIVGGKIVPLWSKRPDKWIYDYGTRQIHPVFAYLDFGDTRKVLETDDVYGCNFAIRRSLALQIGGSYPDTYPRSLKHLSGTGEYGMIANTRSLSYDIVYLPQALVHHHADASRATLGYFIERYERWAIEGVFEAFRNHPKKSAMHNLILKAFDRLAALEEECLTKINPEYYRIIQRAWAYQMIEQTFRVVFDASLYRHIRQESYW